MTKLKRLIQNNLRNQLRKGLSYDIPVIDSEILYGYFFDIIVPFGNFNWFNHEEFYNLQEDLTQFRERMEDHL